MTNSQALTQALILAITAPDDFKAQLAIDLSEELAKQKTNNHKMTSEKSNIPPKKSNNRKMTSEKSNIIPPLSNQINILPYNQS